MTASQRPENPTVFISYAHETLDGQSMQDQVLLLRRFLEEKGIDVVTDHDHGDRPPQEGWHHWMMQQIQQVDIVLVVCTHLYKQRFEKTSQDTASGYGVTWEGAIINAHLYNSLGSNEKFFPILPDQANTRDVPDILQG